jgi:hypothetical protein
VKGTKLWNAPRSPLIQGRSRRENPFSRDWLVGGSAAFIISAVAAGMFLADKGASWSTLTTQVVVPALAGAALGGALGVRLATGFGWHPRWVGGALLGAILGVAAVVMVVVAGIGLFGV